MMESTVYPSTKPVPVWWMALLIHKGLARLLWPYQTVFLMLFSEKSWNSIVESGYGFVRVVCLFFAPMLFTLAWMEGWGLRKWIRHYEVTGVSRPITSNEAIALEALRCLMILLAMLVCAHLLRVFAGTFKKNRNTYRQALIVVIYSFAPICLFRVFLVFYPFNEWLLWAFGMVLALKVLYHGLPRILEPDSPQALGLFFMSAFSLCLVTLLERFITLCYLCKECRPPALI
jgi:hypothetical protein